MSRIRRPIAVTAIACLYIAIGVIGFFFHWPKLPAQHPFQYDVFWIELVELLALLCGIFLLRGQNWARWLAVVWIAFHVVLSAFHALGEFAIHAVFCALITWLLFRPDAALYFRRAAAEAA